MLRKRLTERDVQNQYWQILLLVYSKLYQCVSFLHYYHPCIVRCGGGSGVMQIEGSHQVVGTGGSTQFKLPAKYSGVSSL